MVDDQVTFNSTGTGEYAGVKGTVVEVIDVPEGSRADVGHPQWVRVKTNRGSCCDGLYSGLFFVPEMERF